jgi:hypothetical protein
MKTQELHHGASADNILGIVKDGGMKPAGGEIFFVKRESQLHTCFAHGADRSRGAAFVIKVKIHIPDHIALKPVPKPGNPDAWVLFGTNRCAARSNQEKRAHHRLPAAKGISRTHQMTPWGYYPGGGRSNLV